MKRKPAATDCINILGQLEEAELKRLRKMLDDEIATLQKKKARLNAEQDKRLLVMQTRQQAVIQMLHAKQEFEIWKQHNTQE